jgi:NCAIR mutase (PurE)-related protein
MLQGCAAGVGVIQIQKLDLIAGQRNENLQRICRARHRRLAQMRERFGQIFAVH